MRLDSFITEKFNLKSRTYANRIIKDGLVSVDSKTVTQPSKEIIGTEVVELIKKEAFASFGGEKLKKAIEHFNISVTNKFCVDIGCDLLQIVRIVIKAVLEIFAGGIAA